MRKTRNILKLIALLSLLTASLVVRSPGQSSGDALESGFRNPPDSAKPRVWWHWMNGNITKEGIKLDLEWMKRVGIGGFQNFDAALNTPKLVEKRLVYMTPEWKDAFLYTTNLADQLGLEEAIAGSPGWSESGGPWASFPNHQSLPVPIKIFHSLIFSRLSAVKSRQPHLNSIPIPKLSLSLHLEVKYLMQSCIRR
jgi:hypothetical protein